jgi:hypothetical protein
LLNRNSSFARSAHLWAVPEERNLESVQRMDGGTFLALSGVGSGAFLKDLGVMIQCTFFRLRANVAGEIDDAK